MAPERRSLRELRSLIAPIVGQEAADKLVDILKGFDADRLATKADMARMDDRFDAVDRRFEQVDQRFEQVDQRFERVDRRFEALEGQVRELRHELLAAFRGELVTAVSVQTRMMLFGMLGAVVTMAAAALAFAQLLA
jgi:DNA repair ATPase RecN